MLSGINDAIAKQLGEGFGRRLEDAAKIMQSLAEITKRGADITEQMVKSNDLLRHEIERLNENIDRLVSAKK